MDLIHFALYLVTCLVRQFDLPSLNLGFLIILSSQRSSHQRGQKTNLGRSSNFLIMSHKDCCKVLLLPSRYENPLKSQQSDFCCSCFTLPVTWNHRGDHSTFYPAFDYNLKTSGINTPNGPNSLLCL